MVIFPISAIGLNVTIHKCKLEGTLHITFFETKSDQNNSDCCCDHHKSNDKDDTKHLSCCSKEIDKKLEAMQNELPSCCKDKEKTPEKTSNQNKESEKDNSGNEYFSSVCCSNSLVSSALIITAESANNNKVLISVPLFINTFLTDEYLNSKICNNDTKTEIRYPLKEPICDIISFIHFTSNNSDEAGPNPQFVLYQIA